MIARRGLLGAVAVLAAASAASAQPAGKVYRVGYLSGGSAAAGAAIIDAFRQALREGGWVEGRNLVIEYRFAEGRPERLAGLAAELVRLPVDLIVAAPTDPTLAARTATRTIPIVMIGPADPVGQGLVASLARPGGNVTGLSYSVGVAIFGKQLELLKEMAPQARRLAVLSNRANAAYALWRNDAQSTGRSLGVPLQLLEVRGPEDFDAAFAALATGDAAAVLVWGDPVLDFHRARLLDLVARSRLPAAYTQRAWVEAGGLMSYGPSFADLWRRAAGYVDKILKGAKPADLPVEQPTKFELVINLKTAKALGLTLPQTLLLRADEVIE
jgi:putative tryptophan/tyrosine transport system substrate-binding protein